MRPTTNLAVLAAAVVTNQGGVTPQQQQHAAAVGDRAMMLATLMPNPGVFMTSGRSMSMGINYVASKHYCLL